MGIQRVALTRLGAAADPEPTSVTMLHVLRVFIGPDGSGGNPLGVFVEGGEIAPERRQAVAHDLDFSETVFVDSVDDGVARIVIHTPATELPFAGHPAVGTGWLLRNLDIDVRTLRCVSGDVAAWQDGELAWIRARPDWVRGIPEPDRLASAAAVDSVVPPQMGEPGRYVWAWDEEAAAGSGLASSRPTWGLRRTRRPAPPPCCSAPRSGAT